MMLSLALALPAVRRVGPALDLMFAGASSLDSRVTFTRSSQATYRDNTGTRQTAANNVARFDHTAAGVPLGLLIEEQRTNLLLNSAALSTQSVSVTAQAYTLSFEGTGSVTLSGASTAGPLAGTGANNRVSLTFTPTAGTLTLTVSGSVTAANLEAGSFGTSWIPTAGAQATRSADVATITGSNFTSWFNPSEGTFVAEASILGTTGDDRGIIAVQSASSVGRGLEVDASTARSEGVTRNATSVGVASSFVAALASVHRAAMAYTNGGTMSVCSDGGTVATSAATDSVSPTSANIGKQDIGGGRGYLNGHLRRLSYYPTRRTDLQALTA